MRLIDADAMHTFVEEKVAEGKDGWANGVPYEWAYALTAVDMQPTIDAVEVVRCKDCIHTTRSKVNPEKIICCLTLMCGTTEPDFFCAHGEHKMDAEVEG